MRSAPSGSERASSYKRFASETLMDAIRAAADGLTWLPPALQAELAKQWREPEAKTLHPATRDRPPRRARVHNAEIAKKLFISEVTVKTHLNNVFQKVSVRDRVSLVRYAIRIGLIDVHEQES